SGGRFVDGLRNNSDVTGYGLGDFGAVTDRPWIFGNIFGKGGDQLLDWGSLGDVDRASSVRQSFCLLMCFGEMLCLILKVLEGLSQCEELGLGCPVGLETSKVLSEFLRACYQTCRRHDEPLSASSFSSARRTSRRRAVAPAALSPSPLAWERS